MGKTLAALQAGSTSFVWVVRISGYSSLLSNGNAADVAGLAIGDWTTVITGLTVEIDNQQTLDPWNPFQPAGTCVLRVPRDTTTGADTFGVDVAKTNGGRETYLRATLDRSSTAMVVKRSDDFAQSGLLYCGNECIEYSAKPSSTSITASKRGKYSEVFGASRFADQHRVMTASNGVRIEPVVSEQPRTWIGRRVGVWMHRTFGPPGTGAIDSVADAQLVFAGTISELREDTQTGNVSIIVEHYLNQITKATIASEMWEANAINGFYLSPGMIFQFRDFSVSGAWKIANNLTVAPIGTAAVGTNQISEGLYSIEDIATAINSWLAGELVASRIYGTYTMKTPLNVDGGPPRTLMVWSIPSGSSGSASWIFTFPLTSTNWGGEVLGVTGNLWYVTDFANSVNRAIGDTEPGTSAVVFRPSTNVNTPWSVQMFVEAQSGTFADQYATLPSPVKALLPAGGGGLIWGIFTIGEMLVVGSPSTSFGVTTISNIYMMSSPLTVKAFSIDDFLTFRVKSGDPPPRVRQLFVHEGAAATLWKYFFYSTGTHSYNDPSFDALPNNQGIGVPGDLLSAFQTSCDLIPSAQSTLLVVIDKPTRFIDLFAADLVLRRTHLIWKNQSLRLVCWSTPNAAAAALALTESTKAEAAGVQANHRSVPALDSTWVKPIIKINYNRDILSSAGGKTAVYRNWVTIEDSVSADDLGNLAKSYSLDCRNVFADATDMGQGVQALLPGFLAWMPFFSRPIRKVTRSFDQRYAEGYAPGDVVALSDLFIRDSKTGLRGITAKSGLITRHRWRYGGPVDGDPTKVTGQGGELDIVFLELERIPQYSPCAQIDENQPGSGYDGSFTVSCYQHKHSEVSEFADAASFGAGDKVRIIEIDPADPNAPLTWLRTVQSQTGNNIVLTAALATPAFDTTKRYRVLSDAYSNAQATQQPKAYQAGGDGTVAQLVPAFQYGQSTGLIAGTRLDHTEIPELHSLAAYGPDVGAPRDTGYDKALAVLLENLMDHKTSRHRPMLDHVVRSNTTNVNGWRTLFISPYFLGAMSLVGGLNRRLYVAPFFRSNNGSTVSVRVSLTGTMPTDATLDDIVIHPPFQSLTWTTQETTWSGGAEQYFYLANYNGLQWAYLILEASYLGESRFLSECVERERVQT